MEPWRQAGCGADELTKISSKASKKLRTSIWQYQLVNHESWKCVSSLTLPSPSLMGTWKETKWLTMVKMHALPLETGTPVTTFTATWDQGWCGTNRCLKRPVEGWMLILLLEQVSHAATEVQHPVAWKATRNTAWGLTVQATPWRQDSLDPWLHSRILEQAQRYKETVMGVHYLVLDPVRGFPGQLFQ